MNFNHKRIGEIGERIAIGELAKYGIDVLLPMSDNLPYDFVIYYNNKFYKCQVKTTNSKTNNNSLCFSIVSSNWYSKTIHKYSSNEVDIIICCDLKNIYLFSINEVNNKTKITIREEQSNNNQVKNINFAKDYIISEERIKQVLR